MAGGSDWLHEAITDGSLLVVTNGLYICKMYPNLCYTTFVLECTKGRGRMIGLFSKSLQVANASRGELLGLMAIHLILLSVDRIHGTIAGSGL